MASGTVRMSITPHSVYSTIGTITPRNSSRNGLSSNCWIQGTANKTCKTCATRCPAGAITAKGHDKDKCSEYSYGVIRRDKNKEYGVTITGCGLCQTKVPCEFEIPKLIQKERQPIAKHDSPFHVLFF